MRNILFIGVVAIIIGTAICVAQNPAKGKISIPAIETSYGTGGFSDRKELVTDIVFSEEKETAKSSEIQVDAASESNQATNAVCPNPSQPCHHRRRKFEAWELPFRLPARIVANKTYSSQRFYAVILKKYDNACDEGLDYDSKIEAERIGIQKKFVKKVFAEYSCPNMDAVSYSFEGKMDAAGERVLYMDYIAVYAGATEREARAVLENIRADYPQAELKRMTATYERLEM